MFSIILQWTLVCTLLYYVNPLLAMEKINITREIKETRLANPMTVRVGSHLFTVSKTNKSLSVKVVEPGQEACQLIVSVVDENIQGRIHVAPLEISRKILVWGVQSTEFDDSLRRIYYTLLFVDPIGCSYKRIRLPGDKVLSSWPVLAPTIVPYYDRFYVFYQSQKRCSPCQYNALNGLEFIDELNESETLSIKLNTERDLGIPVSEFRMQTYLSKEDWNYYLYVSNFDSGTAVMKLISPQGSPITSSFIVSETVRVNHTIDAVSISYGHYQNTAICYATASNPGPTDHQNISCERLNERLRPGLSWQLPASNDTTVSRIVLEVDKLGNTLVGVLYNNREIRLYAYNVDGDLVDDLNFSQADPELPHKELYGIRIHSEYCLVTVEQANVEAVEAQHVIKCIDVSEYFS